MVSPAAAAMVCIRDFKAKASIGREVIFSLHVGHVYLGSKGAWLASNV